MIEICGDLVRDLPYKQQASYLEGGPLMWMLPLYLRVNQKPDYDKMRLLIQIHILNDKPASVAQLDAPSDWRP